MYYFKLMFESSAIQFIINAALVGIFLLAVVLILLYSFQNKLLYMPG